MYPINSEYGSAFFSTLEKNLGFVVTRIILTVALLC